MDANVIFKTEGELTMVLNKKGYATHPNCGYIYDQDMQLVCGDTPALVDIPSKKGPSGSTACYAYDGTRVRLFFYDNAWRLATNRCIDAYKSYFPIESTTSFGTQFDSLFKCDYNVLDPNYVYVWVVTRDLAKLVYIARIERATNLAYDPFDVEDHPDVQKYRDSTVVTDAEIGRGLIFKVKNSEGVISELYKYEFNKDYVVVPVLEKYFYIMHDSDAVAEFNRIHGDKEDIMRVISRVDNGIYSLSTMLAKRYIESHIKRKYWVSQTDLFYPALRTIHRIRMTMGVSINQDTVRDLLLGNFKLFKITPGYLSRMLIPIIYTRLHARSAPLLDK